MGARCTGAGGFIDITQNAKKVVFLGTFTAGGAKYKFENRKLEILQEGKIRKKMVRQVAQLSFNGPMARKKRTGSHGCNRTCSISIGKRWC